MISAGTTVRNLNNKTTIAKTYGDMITNIKASDLQGVSNIQMPEIGTMRDMGGQDLISWAVTQGEGMTPEERSYFYTTVMNMPGLAVNKTVTGEAIAGANQALPEGKLLEHRAGFQSVAQKARFAKEATSINERTGQAEAAAKIVADNLNVTSAIGTGTAGAAALLDYMFGGPDEPKQTAPDTSMDNFKDIDNSGAGIGEPLVPSASFIGNLPAPGAVNKQVNNVNVDVNVDNDGVTTKATVNDTTVLDEQFNLGTGGN